MRNAAAIVGFGASRVSMDAHGMSDCHRGLRMRTHLEFAVISSMCTAIHQDEVWEHLSSTFPFACAQVASALMHEPVRWHSSVLASEQDAGVVLYALFHPAGSNSSSHVCFRVMSGTLGAVVQAVSGGS